MKSKFYLKEILYLLWLFFVVTIYFKAILDEEWRPLFIADTIIFFGFLFFILHFLYNYLMLGNQFSLGKIFILFFLNLLFVVIVIFVYVILTFPAISFG